MTVCDFCGARSRLRHLFVSWPTGLGRPGLICPRCRSLRRPFPTLPGWPLVVGLVVAGAGFAVGGPRTALVWVAGVLLLPAALTAAHELAHALAGKLTGARIFEVRVGWHKPRYQVRLGRLRFTIARGLLRGGYCVAAYLKGRARAWRYALLFGTPMLLHAAAAAAVLPLLDWPRTLPAIGLGHFFVAFNLVFLLASARPFDYAIGAFVIPSDGKALLLLLTQPAQVENWRRTGFVVPAVYALLDAQHEEAAARARDAEHLFPGDPDVERALFTVYWALGYHAYALRFLPAYARGVRQPAGLDERQLLALGAMQDERLERWLHAAVYLHGGAWDAAIKEVETALADEKHEEGRAMWLALRANVLLLRRGSGDAMCALADANAAYERLPWVSFICGVMAGALVENGRHQQCLEILEDADLLDESGQELPIRNLWRAVAFARMGKLGPARRSMHEAQARGLEVGPPPALMRRAEAALADSSR